MRKQKYTKKELRKRRRIHDFKDAMNFGGTSVGERQLYSGRPYYDYGKAEHPKDVEQLKEESLDVLETIQKMIGLRQEFIDDFNNGIVDIAYLDSDLNGHVIHLEDDPEFLAAAKYLEDEIGAIPIIGFKWDGQHSPVFMAKRDEPEELGVDEYGIPIIPLGSSNAAMMTCAHYRYLRLGVYFWINGQLYDDLHEFESHDGIPYPVVAFPDLPDQDGVPDDAVKFP